MSEQHNNQPSNVEKFASHPITSVLLTALSAVIPPISITKDMIDKSVTKIQQDRFDTMLDELSKGEIELTEELIQSEEFIHSFVVVYKAVIHTYSRKKIRCFARILTHSIIHSELATDRFEEYVRLLEDLSSRELYLLDLLRSLDQEYCSKQPENCEGTKGKMTHGIWNEFLQSSSKHLKVSEEDIKSIMLGLTRTGFYSLMAGVTFGYSNNIGIGQTTAMWVDFCVWIESRNH